MFKFFMEMLQQTNNRLAESVRAKGDYEINPRASTKKIFEEYGYEVVIEGELFHFTKSLWKRVGKFHLRGLYMFSNGGDTSYFNPFQFFMQLLFCITLLPWYAVKKTYLYIKPQLQLVHDYYDYNGLSLTKTNVKKSIHNIIQYVEKTWMGDETTNAKYSIKDSNNYLVAVRTTNNLETWHNLLRATVGVREDIFDFIKGNQKLENKSVLEFYQYCIHGLRHTRRKEYVEREKKLTIIWQKCETKINSVHDPHTIEAEFWFDILVEIQTLFYSDKNNLIANIDQVVS